MLELFGIAKNLSLSKGKVLHFFTTLKPVLVLVPVRASPVPRVVRGILLVKILFTTPDRVPARQVRFLAM